MASILGAFRHNDVEVCSVGALALWFFHAYHVQKRKWPNFTERKTWYEEYVSPGMGGSTTRSCPEVWRKRVTEVLKELNISSKKKTYFGRLLAVMEHNNNGTGISQTKKMGGWNKEQYDLSYNKALPSHAMIVAAGFETDNVMASLRAYRVPRTEVDPKKYLAPEEFKSIFPQADTDLQAIKERNTRASAQGVMKAVKLVQIITIKMAQRG
eukprot:1190669-Prorocentrum_minimum.AAC.4